MSSFCGQLEMNTQIIYISMRRIESLFLKASILHSNIKKIGIAHSLNLRIFYMGQGLHIYFLSKIITLNVSFHFYA